MRKKIIYRIKALFTILLFYLIKPFSFIFRIITRKKPIYIFTERGFDAEDNAYILFEYSKTKVNSYYLITKHNKYKDRFLPSDKLINYGTLKHLFMIQCAEFIISTHGYLYIPAKISINRIGNIFKLHAKIIFLQHGVMKDKVDGLNYYDMFLTSTNDEFEFIKKETGLDDSVVKCLGLPRFDILDESRNNKTKKQVLVMPTWRLYLKSKEQIINSKYLKMWLDFINDKYLKSELSKRNYSIIFFPHIDARKYIPDELIYNTKKSVQELLIESSILITDYSSVQFDFAYLFKPVLYYQFDYNDHYGKHHQKGYYDERTSGFGPVSVDKNELIQNLLNIIDNPEKQKIYIERAKKTFKFIDSNNRKRVFDELKNIKKHYY